MDWTITRWRLYSAERREGRGKRTALAMALVCELALSELAREAAHSGVVTGLPPALLELLARAGVYPIGSYRLAEMAIGLGLEREPRAIAALAALLGADGQGAGEPPALAIVLHGTTVQAALAHIGARLDGLDRFAAGVAPEPEQPGDWFGSMARQQADLALAPERAEAEAAWAGVLDWYGRGRTSSTRPPTWPAWRQPDG